jgi:hypothetical protein
MPLTEDQIKAIQNKLCPTGMDEAVLYFFKEVINLKHENAILRDELKELRWRLTEQD